MANERRALIGMIPFVSACMFTNEVEDYLIDRDVQIHYQDDVTFVENDGNVFAEWLKKECGIEFDESKNGMWIAILST